MLDGAWFFSNFLLALVFASASRRRRCHTRIFDRISNILGEGNYARWLVVVGFAVLHVNSCVVPSKVNPAKGATHCYRCLQKQFPYVDFRIFFSFLFVARNLCVVDFAEHKNAHYISRPCVICALLLRLLITNFPSCVFFSFTLVAIAAFPHEFLFSKSKRFAYSIDGVSSALCVRVAKIWIWNFWGANAVRRHSEKEWRRWRWRKKKIQILSWRCQKFPSAINKDNNIRELFYRFRAARKLRIYDKRRRTKNANQRYLNGFWLCATCCGKNARAHERQLIIVCENEISKAIEMRHFATLSKRMMWRNVAAMAIAGHGTQGKRCAPAKIDQWNF